MNITKAKYSVPKREIQYNDIIVYAYSHTNSQIKALYIFKLIEKFLSL